MPVVDNFFGYYDPVLRERITSNRQREKLMKKHGLHYAEDNPKNREIRKMAEFYKGKHGDRKLDEKATREWFTVSEKLARQQLRERAIKSVK